jgi:hypothetical protein
MTLDTYTHLFGQAAHGADVRAQLAQSDFANLLSRPREPRLPAGEQLRTTRAATPRRLPKPLLNAPLLLPAQPRGPPLLRDQNVTNRFRQLTRQRV